MTQFIFTIPLSLETGVELVCEGIIPRPVLYRQLYDAVIYSLHVGPDLDAKIQISTVMDELWIESKSTRLDFFNGNFNKGVQREE